MASVVVVGASAGGVEALRALVSGFPVDLPAAVVVVLHIPRNAPSALPAILGRAGPLRAAIAEHGAPIEPGTVYVAPADRHVLLDDSRITLSAGPTENGHRPAIDPLFRSAALAFGPRAVGVVLSGTRDDGAAGLAAIAARGGTALVQDPTEALYGAMPVHALEAVPTARALPAAKIGEEIAERLAAGPADPDGPPPPPDDLLVAEAGIAAMDPGAEGARHIERGRPATISCPSCDGVLFEVPGGPTPRYRCRVGHAWSPESLDSAQAGAVEGALWTALRTLEERAATLRWLAEQAQRRGHDHAVTQHRRRAAKVQADAGLVRGLLGQVDAPDLP